VAVVALLVNLVFLAGQLYSLIAWDSAVEHHMQEYRFETNRGRARQDWGICIADMLWQLPLTLVAFFGLMGRFPFAYSVAMMALSLEVYWPIINAAQRWGHASVAELVALLIFVSGLAFLGILGLAANRDDLHKPRAGYDPIAAMT